MVVRREGALLVVREKGGLSWLSERRRGATLVVPQSRDTAAGDFPVGPALG